MGKFTDLIGQRFGKLVVIALAGRDKWGMRKWTCICDCGGSIEAWGHNLKNGTTSSCGCKKRDIISKARTKHGHAKKENISKAYRAWGHMKERCYNSTCKEYRYYGIRGITVCDRWLDKDSGFENFIEDMGECPLGMSLDRIDNNGNYEPENCRWATATEQCNNRRNSKLISYNGEIKTLSQWSNILNINYHTLRDRLNSGVSVEKAFTTPVDMRYSH